MKIKGKGILFVALLAVAGLFGVTSALIDKQVKETPVVEKANADSTMVSGSRVFIQDESGKGWTQSGVDPIMHIYSVSFITGSGYTSIADIKANDVYGDIYARSGNYYIDIKMKWCESGSGQRYEAILPWFVSGFTTEFYAPKAGEGERYAFYKNSDGKKGGKVTVTLSRGDNLSIYIFNTSDWRGECYWSGSDFVAITDIPTRGTGYTYEFNGIYSGSHLYLSTQDLTGWEQDSAKIGICFGKSNINQGQAWSSQYDNVKRNTPAPLRPTFAWKVQGSGNDHLFECIVPQYNGQDVYWSMVIGVRFSSGAASPGWSNVLNQTGDQFYNGDDSNCNMLWVNTATGGSWTGGGYLRNDASISNDDRAEYYGVYFNDCIECTGAGSFTDNWDSVKQEYNQHLSTAVEGKVWSATEDPSGATELGLAMSKYDYIIRKYSDKRSDDFINRQTSSNYKQGYGLVSPSNSFELFFKEENNLSIMIIVIASSISLLSITALSVLLVKKRKRKEQ